MKFIFMAIPKICTCRRSVTVRQRSLVQKFELGSKINNSVGRASTGTFLPSYELVVKKGKSQKPLLALFSMMYWGFA